MMMQTSSHVGLVGGKGCLIVVDRGGAMGGHGHRIGHGHMGDLLQLGLQELCYKSKIAIGIDRGRSRS